MNIWWSHLTTPIIGLLDPMGLMEHARSHTNELIKIWLDELCHTMMDHAQLTFPRCSLAFYTCGPNALSSIKTSLMHVILTTLVPMLRGRHGHEHPKTSSISATLTTPTHDVNLCQDLWTVLCHVKLIHLDHLAFFAATLNCFRALHTIRWYVCFVNICLHMRVHIIYYICVYCMYYSYHSPR